MRQLALVVILSALLDAPALAQQASPAPATGDGPPPEIRQRLEQERATALTSAMAAIGADHQRAIDAVVAEVKAGQLTDIRVATQKIDAILTPKEAQGVLAARDKMFSDMRATLPAGGPDRGGPPERGDPADHDGPPDHGAPPDGAGPPPGDGPPRPNGERDGDRRGMRHDAGFALLMLGLDREQMRALFMNSHGPR